MNVPLQQQPVEILIFEVAGQRFGVRSAFVRQLVRAATLAIAPQPRPGIKGLLNLRGQMVVVFDCRRLLLLADTPLQPSDHLIVLQVGQQWLALRADRAERLAALPTNAIESARGIVANCDAIEGIANIGEQLVILLDPGKLILGDSAVPTAWSPKEQLVPRPPEDQSETPPPLSEAGG